MSGFIFTAVLGTILHFAFDWTGANGVLALFSAVNESIWEHMKLLYYPMLLFSVIEYKAWGREYPGFWCVQLVGQLVGLTLIPVLYYTYTGSLGVEVDWFNITIFFLTAGLSFYLEAKLLQKGHSCRIAPKAALAMLLTISMIFTVFTFWTPKIPLFRDPVTGSYGFQPG